MVCKKCNNEFNCTMNSLCWCMNFPDNIPETENTHKLCPECHADKISTALKSGYEFIPKTPKLIKDVEEGVDYNIDQLGRWVFTKYYHLRKGYCCNNDCVNCPY